MRALRGRTSALLTSISVVSNANPVLVRAAGNIQSSSIGSVNQPMIAQLYRNTGAVAIGNMATIVGTSGTAGNTAATAAAINEALDLPASSNWPPTQYGVYIKTATGTNTYKYLGPNLNIGSNAGTIVIEEIQG